MHSFKIASLRAAIVSLLIVIVIAVPLAGANFASAATNVPANYWITIKPATSDSIMYTVMGINWTISFNASWSYGQNLGQPVKNASATVELTGVNGEKYDTLTENTTSGLFNFNYSSSTARIINFNVTKIVTEDKKEWNTTTVLDPQNNLLGLQFGLVTVWYDTFNVTITNSDTQTFGKTHVAVNITYQLLPEAGLQLPGSATYSHQTFLPKIASGVTVTINSVTAQETADGIYEADIPTWTPTSYILVGVSEIGWKSTATGFSFSQNANSPIWEICVGVGVAFILGIAALSVFTGRKSKVPGKAVNLPFLGGLMLAVTSAISLYWGLVGLDATMHGFDWLLLTILGLLSFVFALVGAIMSMRKKNQALAITSAIAPLVALVAVQTSLSSYGLTVPMIQLGLELSAIIVGEVLICNADAQFIKTESNTAPINSQTKC
jgi:hypothetical protein